jgi:hypothetical protein
VPTSRHRRSTAEYSHHPERPNRHIGHAQPGHINKIVLRALCARDADKLECMIQGIEYKAQGYENAQRWIDNSRRRLTTKSANELADAVLATESLDWLRAALGETQS